MTGEMSTADLKDYPQFFALAKKIRKNTGLRAEVRPFDVYQGPYILVENRLRIWGTEASNVWFIDKPHGNQAGYTVVESKLYQIVREIMMGSAKKKGKGYTERRTQYSTPYRG